MSTLTAPLVELSLAAEPDASVIWLHGLGADGWDFVPIVKELQLPDSLAVRFVFPHAPRQAVTVNGGAVMPAWYDIAMAGLDRQPDAKGIRASGALVDGLIEREIRRGIASQRIVLAGFSQGGVIAQHAGLRQSHPLGGILALSTYLGLPDTLALEAHPANAATPLLLAHGTQDNVVPLALAERSRQHLLGLHYAVEWQTYPMGHTVAREELRTIRDFLVRRLGSSSAS